MTQAGGTSKICVVCGTDCAAKPRTKDPKGRYYCQECYQKVKSQHAGPSAQGVTGKIDSPPRKPSAPPRPKPQPSSLLSDNDDIGLGELNILDDLVESPPVIMPGAANACPHCGHAIAFGAMLCTSCGYNMQTGQQLSVSTSKVKEKSGTSAIQSVGFLKSPMVIGLLCIGFFIGFFALARGNEQLALAYVGVQFLFGLIASILVIIAGFRESVLYGLGCFLCFPVAIYVAFVVNENAYIKWLYLAALIASGLGFLLGDVLPHRSF